MQAPALMLGVLDLLLAFSAGGAETLIFVSLYEAKIMIKIKIWLIVQVEA